jgi:hypothetical protein
MKTSSAGWQSETNPAPPGEAAASASQRPETFRLPGKTGRDPYFGFSRSFYYVGEQRGYWQLIRIRDRGKWRGLTLIPFDQVLAFVRKQREAA